MRLLLALLLACAAPAFAGSKSANQAEVRRLSEDAERLAQRGAWSGVERNYVQLLALERKGATLTHAMHVLGAYASQNRGDPMATWDRLKSALAVENTLETLTWKADLEATYSRFVIEVAPSYEGELSITSLEPVFDPVQAGTVKRMSEQLAANRRVEGLLPLGRYRLGDLTLESYGGDTQTVMLRPKGSTVADPTTISPLQAGTTRFSLVAPDATMGDAWTEVTERLSAVAQQVPGVARVDVVDPSPHWLLYEFQPELFASIGLSPLDLATAVRESFRVNDAQILVGPSQLALDPTVASLEAVGRLELSIGDTLVPLSTVGMLREGPKPGARVPGADVVLDDDADAESIRAQVLAAIAAEPVLAKAGLRPPSTEKLD